MTITNLLGIEDNLLELSSLCKALNNLIGNVCSEVDTEGKCGIHRLHQVSKFLRALQLQTDRQTHKHSVISSGRNSDLHKIVQER